MELRITGTERVINSIYALTEGSFDDVLDKTINRIEAKVLAAHESFFKTLVQSGIDVKSAPNLGIYKPTWSPLRSRKYQEQRKRKYGVYFNRFYRNSGQLKTTLSDMSATTTFGKPLVLYKTGSIAKGDKLEVRYEKWKGQSKRRRVIRGPKGRIMPNSTRIPKNLRSQIVVDVFPKVTEDIRENLNLKPFFDEKTIYKLTNDGGARPLIGNYMNWWINTKIRKVIKGVI